MIIRPILPLPLLLAATLILVLIAALLVKHRNSLVALIRRLAMLVVILMILIRPMITGNTSIRQENSLNIYFGIDLTNSMAVEDSKLKHEDAARYKKMAEDIRSISANFLGAKHSIAALDTSVHTLLPLTNDTATVDNYLSAMKASSNEYGSTPSQAELVNYIYNHIEDNHERYPERKNIVFIMSDGEDANESAYARVSEKQKSLVSASYVIGYGSVEGALVPDLKYKNGYVLDNDYKPHVSKINESTLKNIASEIGAEYYNWNINSPDEDSFKKMNDSLLKDSDSSISSYQDIYWLLALILIALLLWDFSECINAVFDERKAVTK